jgi:choline transport protein
VVVTYCFCIQDIYTEIVTSTAAYPWIIVVANATNSNAAAVVMAAITCVLGFAGAISMLAAASRQAWAFARDGE